MEATTGYDYAAYIEKLDLEDRPDLINNSSTEHAIPLIARLIARGQREIVLFTGSLNPVIYAAPAVLSALGTFLVGRAGALRILVQQNANAVPDTQLVEDLGGALSKLKADLGLDVLNRVLLHRASVPVGQLRMHFMVVDEKSFRLEPDNSKHEAVASFNLPSIATSLKSGFDRMFASSQGIALG